MSDEAGFTLVEALVALSLVGLITLVAFSGLRLAGDAWARTDRQSQVAGAVASAQAFLRQAIEQAYPGLHATPGAPTEMTFRGEATAMELSAPVPYDLSAGGRHRILITLAVEEKSLAIAWSPERGQKAAGAGSSWPRQATLMTGLQSVNFSYFGQARGEPQARWHREWVGQPVLPSLVRVEAKLADSLARWPILDAAPRADVDATCVLDLLSRRCRGR